MQKKINKNFCEADAVPFLFGFANSMFQSSGDHCGHSNWTHAATNGTVPSSSKDKYISHWINFEDDLDLMQKMGVNSYRFSIEWSHVEPQPGVFDETVLARYEEILAACRTRNIEPMITLYHFNEPLWFTQQGGFEKPENIKYFLAYCEMIFKRFSQQVKYWCTINEPGTHAICGYFFGIFPPHKHSINKTIRILNNLLEAHVKVYQTLKSLPEGNQVHIGLVHNVLRFVPRYRWEPLENWLSKFMTEICDDLIQAFLKTGHFNYDHWIARTHTYNPDAPHSYDFIGLNFYGNAVLGFNFKNFFGPTCFPHQDMGDYCLPIDSEGFARAIDSVSTFKKPIFITETGIADEHDKLRGKFLREYFKVLETKLKEKFDIRGCFLWTFSDNYEWGHGFNIKFGLLDHLRVERESVRELRHFIELMQRLNSKF